MAEISSVAIPFLLRFQARIARSTNRLADLALSCIDDTISTASSFEITSHTYNDISCLESLYAINEKLHLIEKLLFTCEHELTPSEARTINWSRLVMRRCMT